MHMFATSAIYIEMSPWPSPFVMMGRQGYATALKITLSRVWLKCKKGRMMRICLSWIQAHPHIAIWRHLLNAVNLFLCCFTKYFENQLQPNDLIVVRNHEDDEEDKWDIKRARGGKEMHTSRWRSNPIQNSSVWLRVQLWVQDHLDFKLMYMTHTISDLDVLHMHRKKTRQNFQWH
jgi:hypothetical protein